LSKVNTGEVEPYPEDHVLGIIDQAADVRAAVEALFAAGYDHKDVTVLCGQRGLELMDADGTRHGPVGRVIRLVQNFGPSENTSGTSRTNCSKATSRSVLRLPMIRANSRPLACCGSTAAATCITTVTGRSKHSLRE